MAREPIPQIPELTDIVPEADTEALIAELQTRLAAAAFVLSEDILRSTFAEMEAKLFAEISGRLRRELPELIDSLLREHLERNPDEQG